MSKPDWTVRGPDGCLLLLFNLGNALAVLAFAVRGPILLRGLAVAGALLQAAYYAGVTGPSEGYGLFWKLVTALVAGGFMALLIRERMGRPFAPEVRPLERALDILTPGQLQKLIAVGEVRRAASERGILARDRVPGELYYLLAGQAQVIKDGRAIEVRAEAFLGEIAFISGGAATADVVVRPGAVYLAWPVDRLRALLERDARIDIALRGLMNHDLARKVAVQPLGQPGRG